MGQEPFQVDQREKQTIQVNQHHIDDSTQGQGLSCMVTEAVREALDVRDDVVILTSYTSIGLYVKKKSGTLGKALARHKLNRDTAMNIKQFDASRELVQPFEFELDLPADWREKVVKARQAAQNEEDRAKAKATNT